MKFYINRSKAKYISIILIIIIVGVIYLGLKEYKENKSITTYIDQLHTDTVVGEGITFILPPEYVIMPNRCMEDLDYLDELYGSEESLTRPLPCEYSLEEKLSEYDYRENVFLFAKYFADDSNNYLDDARISVLHNIDDFELVKTDIPKGISIEGNPDDYEFYYLKHQLKVSPNLFSTIIKEPEFIYIVHNKNFPDRYYLFNLLESFFNSGIKIKFYIHDDADRYHYYRRGVSIEDLATFNDVVSIYNHDNKFDEQLFLKPSSIYKSLPHLLELVDQNGDATQIPKKIAKYIFIGIEGDKPFTDLDSIAIQKDGTYIISDSSSKLSANYMDKYNHQDSEVIYFIRVIVDLGEMVYKEVGGIHLFGDTGGRGYGPKKFVPICYDSDIDSLYLHFSDSLYDKMIHEYYLVENFSEFSQRYNNKMPEEDIYDYLVKVSTDRISCLDLLP